MLQNLTFDGNITVHFNDAKINIYVSYHDDNYAFDVPETIYSFESVKIDSPEITDYSIISDNILVINTKDGKEYEIYADELLSAIEDYSSALNLIDLLNEDKIFIHKSLMNFLSEYQFV